MIRACVLVLALTSSVCEGATGTPTGTATKTTSSAPFPVTPSERSCFPGEAVTSSGQSVAEYDGQLGALHSVGPGAGPASFFAVLHEAGEFRASGNHLLFNGDGIAVATESLALGSELLLAAGLPSRVLSIRKDITKHGMFAPLTKTGTIEVDGACASNYATVSSLAIPHSAMHALFFASRMCSAVRAYDAAALESVNPIAYLLHNVLKVDKFL